MNIEQQTELANDLMRRVMEGETGKILAAMPHIVARGLDAIADTLDIGPDANWFKDFFRLTGDHMVLTEEGWIRADHNTFEVTGEDPVEVLDEVNAPAPV